MTGRCVVAFLGGTIGNFFPADRQRFLKEMSAIVGDDDHILVGFDLVKDVGRLESAYNDGSGVTAEFNRNVLHVINQRLDGDFDATAFRHVAFFDRDEEWIEMRLEAMGPQRVRVAALDLNVEFADGEQMRTEISAKFRPEGIERELDEAGLTLVHLWTDAANDFALALAR
jgi:L-histidine N-alpha-methyltransferase